MGSSSADAMPGAKELHEMRLVRAFLQETLRLRGAGPTGPRRQLESDVRVSADLVLPQGSLVVLPQIFFHMNPDLFPDPFTFEPGRFLRDDTDPAGWLPFSMGVRTCIGASFALHEMMIVLSSIVARYRVLPACAAEEFEQRAWPELAFTLKPSGGVMVKFVKR
jgi:cytochrome P450